MSDTETPPAPAAGGPTPAPSNIVGETALATITAPASPFGAVHLAGIGAAGFAGNQLLSPDIDYLFQVLQPAIMPSEKVVDSLATLISLGVALLVVRIYRGRAAFAAYITGDPNATISTQ